MTGIVAAFWPATMMGTVGSGDQLEFGKMLLNSRMKPVEPASGHERTTLDCDSTMANRKGGSADGAGFRGSESNWFAVNAELLILTRSINPVKGNPPSHSAPMYKVLVVSASLVPPESYFGCGTRTPFARSQRPRVTSQLKGVGRVGAS